jgi:hypothetical protein
VLHIGVNLWSLKKNEPSNFCCFCNMPHTKLNQCVMA